MKKIAICCMLALLLSGCRGKNTLPAYRVVTGVQVEFEQNGNALFRTYKEQESIQSVLTYLRLLRPFGPVIPEGEHDLNCRITLKYSHGPDRVYLQQGYEYLKEGDSDWAQIDDTQAQLLYPMLLLLPSEG